MIAAPGPPRGQARRGGRRLGDVGAVSWGLSLWDTPTVHHVRVRVMAVGLAGGSYLQLYGLLFDTFTFCPRRLAGCGRLVDSQTLYLYLQLLLH